MLNTELIQNAILKSRLNGRDPKVQAQAQMSLNDAIRKYSADGTVNGFQKVITAHINNGQTTIGRPLLKRGLELHYCHKGSQLPDLTGYDPDINNFGYIMDRDYFFVDTYMTDHTPGLYEIVEEEAEDDEDPTYAWQKVEVPGYICDINPNVWVWDVDSISCIMDNVEWYPLSLKDFYTKGKPTETYAACVTGDGIITIYASKESDVTIIYNAVFDNAECTRLNIPPMQQLLLQAYVAWDITRAPAELKNELAAALDELETSSRGISMQNAPILTWRG